MKLANLRLQEKSRQPEISSHRSWIIGVPTSIKQERIYFRNNLRTIFLPENTLINRNGILSVVGWNRKKAIGIINHQELSMRGLRIK